MLACGGPGLPVPSLTPPATLTPLAPGQDTPVPTEASAVVLEVRATSTYVDSFNYYHVVGEVVNAGAQAATGIELMAHVADADGQGAVDGDDRPMDGEIFSPLIYSLAPGESAPFDFFRILPDKANTRKWQASVTVANQAPIELARATVDVSHTRLVTNDSGAVFLTGELGNSGSTPIKISSFAGAVLDADGRLLAANASADFTGWLAPAGDSAGGDHTPFVIKMDGPGTAVAQAVYYVDAEVGEPHDSRGDVSIDMTNRFSDEFDDLHVSANVTNLGAATLTIRLVAGLYAADGTVLDTASATSPIYVAPGASVPVTFEYFDSLNRRADDQELIDHVTVQVDPLWTYGIPYPVAMLQTANEARDQVGVAQYSFRGDVVNSTNAGLTSATLVLAIFDGNNRLVTSSWTIVYPESETFEPGQTLPFDMSVYLPTGVDVSTYTFTTIVQGYVKD
jgi:hypothetical protein